VLDEEFAVGIVRGEVLEATDITVALDECIQALQDAGMPVMSMQSAVNREVYAHLLNDKSALVFIVDPTAFAEVNSNELQTLTAFVGGVREQNRELPIYLFGRQLTARQLPSAVLSEIEGVINAHEDTPEFVARTIMREASRYVQQLSPPFFRALMNYSHDGAYSWHCPGHSGGTAFLKSPVGTMFHHFFGENMLRSDVCNAVEELGQLLDHTGPVAESESRAAETFGSDHLFFVTNGTSTSNKIVWNSAVSQGDIVLVDRNCHKSVLHAIMLTGAIPIYLQPTRNRAGIIGPISQDQFTPESIQQKIENHPFIENKQQKPRILTLTQSTYDGIIYDAEQIKHQLDGFVDVLHFDEAWLPHARFHELYKNMHAVAPEESRTEDSLVFSTQSTHKLLAGLSQASQILVQNAHNSRLDTNSFNEAFMMHTSTSPQYSIIASCDVSAEMMRGVAGHALVEEAITEAMEFRRAVIRVGEELNPRWWFGVWGPDTPARTGLAERGEWELTNGNPWHGFAHVDDGFTMLDPIKVTLTCPGLTVDGEFEELGVPGVVLAKYLAEHGVVVEKTGLYSLFVLFTIGVTKGRWNTLISELHRFKRAFDRNESVAEIMPEFSHEFPQYADLGLRELCEGLHRTYRETDIANLTTDIYLDEPEVAMLPSQAWNAMTSARIEHVPTADLAGRITAVLLTPYPPGIPLLVPGERVTARVERYLAVEKDLADTWPAFNGITHGLGTAADGTHTVACVVE
jgi:arginine decarboxylase